MRSGFYICLNIKTLDGHEQYGQFFLGTDKKFAERVFSSLDGDHGAGEENVIQMDLTEMENGLPVNIRMLGCTLSELSCNVKTITREIFEKKNMHE